MRQKLFGALALSVALAACTNEEELVISTENGSNANLAARPVVGQVDLTTTPATRAAVVDGTWGALAYETGDAIGAALVDQPNFGSVSGKIKYGNNWHTGTWTYAQYVAGQQMKLNNTWTSFGQTDANVEEFYDLCGNGTIANQIHTNYGYTNNGQSWATEASLVEGHYMFYFPYNANNSSRLPISVEIPTTQDCTDGNSAIDALYAGTSPIAVDVAFIKKPAAGEKAAVAATPKHLFAFPQIKIVNNFNGYLYNVAYSGTTVDQENSAKATTTAKVAKTMTINKVELVYTDNSDKKLWTKANINAAALDAAVHAGWEAKKFSTPSYSSSVTDTHQYPSYDQDSKLKPYLTDAVTKAGYAAYDQVITCNINKELTNGQAYTFNVVMPAEKYTKEMLQARVYVTIDGKSYVMLTAANQEIKNSNQQVIKVTGSATGMYKFTKTVELVRGERYPVIEYNTDTDGNTSVKTTAGNILTINLSALTAFETGNYTPAATTRGFETAEEFVAHMQKATRGETMEEVENGGSKALGEHEIAFKNNITLDAALVETIYNNVIYDDDDLVALKLKYTNLAIANDVAVEKKSDTMFKLTGNGKSIFVEYVGSEVINKDGGNLVSGINIISSGCELKKKNGNAGLGVVYLTNNQSYSIKNAADSFRMTLTNGSSLTVNGNCNANITTESGSTVTIGNDGSLTNASSVLNDGTTINNNKMKTIAANVKNNQVFASIAEWPSSVPAASKVNNITINATGTITVEQAGFNIFNANTTITLAETVNEIRSNADVNLTTTNIKQLNGTSCQWIGGSNGNIVVTVSNKHAINSGITAGNACSINRITQ